MSPMYATAVMLLMAAEGSLAMEELVAEDLGVLEEGEKVAGEDAVAGDRELEG